MSNPAIYRPAFSSWIGFEDIFDRIERMAAQNQKAVSNWPPYNVKKLDDNKYLVEMAVAGFGKSDLEVEIDGPDLKISGHLTAAEDNYIYKGIAERNFSRTITLADNVVVKGADLVNGMLKVVLEHIIPDNKRPKSITIGDGCDIKTVKDEKQLLTE